MNKKKLKVELLIVRLSWTDVRSTGYGNARYGALTHSGQDKQLICDSKSRIHNRCTIILVCNAYAATIMSGRPVGILARVTLENFCSVSLIPASR